MFLSSLFTPEYDDIEHGNPVFQERAACLYFTHKSSADVAISAMRLAIVLKIPHPITHPLLEHRAFPSSTAAALVDESSDT